MPGVYKEIRRLVADGLQGEAYELQKKANRIITTLISYSYSGALKAALRMLGMECGNPRLPEFPFDTAKTKELEADLQKADFESLAAM